MRETVEKPEIMVLVNSGAAEPGLVERTLEDRGLAWVTLALDELFSLETTTSYTVSPSEAATLSFADARGRGRFDTGQLRSVWAESTAMSENPLLFADESAGLSDRLQLLSRSEAWMMAVSIPSFLAHDCLYLPQTMERNRANHALYQYRVAREVGFLLPEIYAGRRLAAAIEHLDSEQHQKVHYQSFSPLFFEHGGAAYTSVDRWIEPDRFYTMGHMRSPVLLSNRPAGNRFLSVFLEDRFYTLEIALLDPDLDPDVTDPFYQAAQENLRIEPTELPAGLEAPARSFFRETGLVFGMIDTVESERGPVFLEAHPSTAFTLHHEAGLGVLDHLIDWLRRGRS